MVAALTTMTVGTAFAQDKATTVTVVPVVELNISDEDAEKIFLSVQLPD